MPMIHKMNPLPNGPITSSSQSQPPQQPSHEGSSAYLVRSWVSNSRSRAVSIFKMGGMSGQIGLSWLHYLSQS